VRIPGSKTIRGRLLKALVIPLLSIAAISALVWEFTIEPAMWMEVAKNQQVIAGRAADQIDNFLDQKIDELDGAVQIGSLWNADKERRQETLYRILKLDPQIEEVSMADKDGREIIRLSRLQVYTESDMRWFGKEEEYRRAFEGDVYISPVYQARTAEPSITLAVPVKFASSDIKGVIVARVSLKRLWNSIADIEAGKSAQVFVVDHKGKLIAHPDYSKVLAGTDLSALPEVKEFFQDPDHDAGFGAPLTGQDGKQVMSTFARVKRSNWAVIVEEPVETSLQEVNRIEKLAIWLFAFALGGTFGIGYYFSGGVTRQVRQLEEGAKIIADGNLDYKLAIDSGDEIAILANQFNRMAAELSASHHGMEQKISERTRDLSALYAAMAPLVSTDPGELIRQVAERLKEATHADAVLVRIFDKEMRSYLYPAHLGFPPDYLEATRQVEPDSAIGTAFRTGEPIISPNIRLDPRLKGKKQLEAGFVSCAFLPLGISGDLRGIVHLASRQLGHFDAEKRDHLMAIVRQMGVAMENHKLFEESRRGAQEQAALSAIAMAASQSLEIHEMLQSALDKTLEVTKRTIGIVRLRDDYSGRLRVAGHKGISQAYVGALDADRRIGRRALEVLTTGMVQIMDDPSLQELMEDSRAEGIRSRTWVPIQAHGRILGVLTVASTVVQPFDVREIELLKAIGSIFGTAIANARLFEKTQRDLHRIQALREIDQAITSTMNLDARLDILLEKIDLFFPHPSATAIRLINKKTGRLEFLACCHMAETAWRSRVQTSLGIRAKCVVETGRPVVVRNIAEVAQDPGFYLKEGLVSYIALPLIVKNDVIGVLSLYTKEEHDFTPEEIESLETVVGQAAVAIHEAKLYEETERRRREGEELARLAQSLTETLDPRKVGERIVTSIRQLFNVKGSTLRLIGPDGSLCRVASCGDIFFQSVEDVVPSGLGLTSRAISEERPLWSADLLNDPDVPLSESMRDYHVRSGNRSIVAVPLRATEKIIGALVLSDTTGRVYTEDEIALLQTFADQAALGLENARLFDEVSQKIEELQHKTAELERANKAKDEFLSVMSHELRTPLNVVIGYSAMLKEGIFGDINANQKDALSKILARANDQLQMINSILEATQIGAGAVAMALHEVDLNEFFDALRSTYDLPLQKDIAFHWERRLGLPTIKSDGKKLKHIAQNIIDNAIKFTQKGRITVSLRHMADPGVLEFSVTDTGVGIPKEMLPVIFEMFRQVDSSDNRPFEGVGLGLYIVKKFVEFLGGQVGVESEAGKGSTFTVTIPAAVSDQQIDPSLRASMPQSRTLESDISGNETERDESDETSTFSGRQ
jgi:signal transduction histidine kinase/putative methionine-R-sulfoxide reductase with GAF domain/HAMP domain-containing protein